MHHSSETAIVRLIDLPVKIKGVVSYSQDGTPNIYINSRLSIDQQRKAYLHELEHIHNDDAYNDKTISAVEGLLP